MSLVGALWETKVQFDAARQSTKLDHAASRRIKEEEARENALVMFLSGNCF